MEKIREVAPSTEKLKLENFEVLSSAKKRTRVTESQGILNNYERNLKVVNEFSSVVESFRKIYKNLTESSTTFHKSRRVLEF